MKSSTRLVGAHLISTLGERLSFITLVLQAQTLIDSIWGPALVLMAYTFTFVLAAPVATYFADRFDRRKTLIATDLLRSLFLILYIPAIGLGGGAALLTLVFIVMVLTTIGRAVLWASTPLVVEPAEIPAVNARLAANSDIGLAVGTAIGGLLYQSVSPNFVYIFDAVTYGLSAALFASMSFKTQTSQTPFRLKTWFENVGQSLQEPQVRRPIFALAIGGLVIGLANTHLLSSTPGASPESPALGSVSFLIYSLGSILSALAIGRLKLRSPNSFFFLVFGFLTLGLFFSKNLMAYLVFAFFCGGVATYVTSLLNSEIMLKTPTDLLGTMGATINLFLRSGMALGLVMIPKLSQSPRATIIAVVILSIFLFASQFKIRPTIAAFVAILLLTVQGKSIELRGDQEDVRLSLPTLPESIDNLVWQSLDRWYVMTNVYEQLFYFDRNHNMYSNLLLKWTISKNRKKIDLELKEAAKFSNGDPILADDVVFSLKRCLLAQPKESALRKSFYGAAEFNSIGKPHPGIVAVDSKTIRLNLQTHLQSLWTWLSLPMCGAIISRKTVSSEDLKIIRNDIVSGPYALKSISQTKIRLEKNPFYVAQVGGPRTIGFYKHEGVTDAVDKFKSGVTNLFHVLDAFQPPEINNILTDDALIFPLHRVGFLYLNSQSWPSVSDRKSLAGAFGKNHLVAWKNPLLQWSNSFFPSGNPGYLSEPFALQQRPPSKKRIQILIDAVMAPTQIQEIVKKRLESIGVTVEFVVRQKFEIYQAIAKQEFDAAFLSIGLPTMDASLGIYLYFISKPSYLMDLKGEINTLYSGYLSEENETARAEYLKKIAQAIRSQGLVIPVYNSGVRYILGPGLKTTNRIPMKSDLTYIDIEVSNR